MAPEEQQSNNNESPREMELKGKLKKGVGYVREEIGEGVHNKELELKGRQQRAEGALEENLGKTEIELETERKKRREEEATHTH
ncbi:MAG: hypothetical protein ACYDCK_08500 [Thermoplasmatota archaeon]